MSNQALTAPVVANTSKDGVAAFSSPAPVNGNYRLAAIQNQNNDNSALNVLIQGGARRRRYRGGKVIDTTSVQATTTLPPGPTPIFKETLNGTPYSSQNLTTGAQVTQIDQTAQAKLDNVAYVPQTKTGGARRTKKWGGFHKWRCYSGGKRKSRRHSKKSSRKSRKTRRK